MCYLILCPGPDSKSTLSAWMTDVNARLSSKEQITSLLLIITSSFIIHHDAHVRMSGEYLFRSSHLLSLIFNISSPSACNRFAHSLIHSHQHANWLLRCPPWHLSSVCPCFPLSSSSSPKVCRRSLTQSCIRKKCIHNLSDITLPHATKNIYMSLAAT